MSAKSQKIRISLQNIILFCILLWGIAIVILQFITSHDSSIFVESLVKLTNITNISNESTLLLMLNESMESRKVTLDLFLKQYNRSTLVEFIRNIELSILFQRITNNNNNLNKLYHTGISPHFYNGEFSMNKTCKHLKFAYLCPANINIEKGKINEWTLKINETNLNHESMQFLHELQSKYNFYTDLYDKIIKNINSSHTIFKRKLNILFWGNSHLRQIVEGLQCILDDIEYNVLHHDINQIINIYAPKRKTFERGAIKHFSYKNTFCFGISYGETSKWNDREWNGLHLNSSFIEKLLYSQLRAKNMRSCKTDQLFVQLADDTNLHYKFVHNRNGKSMSENGVFNHLNRSWFRPYHKKLNLTYNILYEIANNFDVIIFNIGNDPVYEYKRRLNHDLWTLRHFNKPVIMLSTFHGVSSEDRKLWNIHNLNQWLYKYYPNVIYINLHNRIYSKLWNDTMNDTLKYLLAGGTVDTPKHFCQPGLIEHLVLALVELINLLSIIYS